MVASAATGTAVAHTAAHAVAAYSRAAFSRPRSAGFLALLLVFLAVFALTWERRSLSVDSPRLERQASAMLAVTPEDAQAAAAPPATDAATSISVLQLLQRQVERMQAQIQHLLQLHPAATLCGPSAEPVTSRAAAWVADGAATDARDLPLRLQLEGCDADAAGGAALEACLAGRHIVFIGDSLTRYQYLNLAQRIVLGTWTAFHGATNAAGVKLPLTELERSWPSWAAFMAGTNERLQGNEICDCYRAEGLGPFIAENRYFYYPALQLRLTYIFMIEAGTTRYHSLDFLNASCGNPCGCRGCVPAPACGLHLEDEALNHYNPEADDAQARFLDSLVVGSVKTATLLAPVDALVMNIGYFGGAGWPRESNKFRHSTVSREVYKRALINVTRRLQALDPPPKALIWKTTTASNGNDYLPKVELAWANATLVPLGWQLFDAYSLTKEFEGRAPSFVERDGVHFKPHVNRGLNEALMLHLCGHVSPGFTKKLAQPPHTCIAARGH